MGYGGCGGAAPPPELTSASGVTPLAASMLPSVLSTYDCPAACASASVSYAPMRVLVAGTDATQLCSSVSNLTDTSGTGGASPPGPMACALSSRIMRMASSWNAAPPAPGGSEPALLPGPDPLPCPGSSSSSSSSSSLSSAMSSSWRRLARLRCGRGCIMLGPGGGSGAPGPGSGAPPNMRPPSGSLWISSRLYSDSGKFMRERLRASWPRRRSTALSYARAASTSLMKEPMKCCLPPPHTRTSHRCDRSCHDTPRYWLEPLLTACMLFSLKFTLPPVEARYSVRLSLKLSPASGPSILMASRSYARAASRSVV
mmetsp:Transcript_13274/g.32432  ORF Transcript_13274/g.32432 Transcript_13274/m.32432 type:complete len:314 (+) Transcript_13274:483-1424(+)